MHSPDPSFRTTFHSFVDTGCWWLRSWVPLHPSPTRNYLQLRELPFPRVHLLPVPVLCRHRGSVPLSHFQGILKSIATSEVCTSLPENFAATALQPSLRASVHFCGPHPAQRSWSWGLFRKTPACKFLSQSLIYAEKLGPKTINYWLKPGLSHYEIFGGEQNQKLEIQITSHSNNLKHIQLLICAGKQWQALMQQFVLFLFIFYSIMCIFIKL